MFCCFAPSVREPAANESPVSKEATAATAALQISAESESVACTRPVASKLSTQVARQHVLAPAGEPADVPHEAIGAARQGTSQSASTQLDARKVTASSLDSAATATLSGLVSSASPVRPSEFSSAGEDSSAALTRSNGLPQQRAASDPTAARGSASKAGPATAAAGTTTPHPAPSAPLPFASSRNSSRTQLDRDASSPPSTAARRLPPPVRTKVSVHSTWSALHPGTDTLRQATPAALLAAMNGEPALLHTQKSRSAPASKGSWHRLTSLLRTGAGSDASADDAAGPAGTASAGVIASDASVGGSLGPWARASSGGSLIAASFHRVASIRQHQLLDAHREASGSDVSSAGSATAATAAAAGDAAVPADPAEAACQQFARHFVQALLSGNATWGSAPEVGAVLDEQCKMIAHDGQTYAGRAAIIRRLNKGMEQLLKLIGVDADNAKQAAEMAGKIERGLDLVNLTRANATELSSAGGSSGLLQRIGSVSRSGGSGGLRAPVATSGSVVVVTYTFKAGLRKFKLQDRFKVRNGLIIRIRRLRL